MQQVGGTRRLADVRVDAVHVFACTDRMLPTFQLRRIRELLQLLKQVRGLKIHAAPILAVRAFDERTAFRRVFAPLPAFDDDFRPVGVFQIDGAPQSARIRMLRPRRNGFDLRRPRIIFAQSILERVDVVLSHVAETAFVIVPIAAEAAVDAMRMVRFHRRGTKPHVIVQNFRNWMRLQIRTTAPHFDFEARRAVARIQADGQRTA